jgi:hypothetical protein
MNRASMEVVNLLLAHGANTDIANTVRIMCLVHEKISDQCSNVTQCQQTARDIALRNGMDEVVAAIDNAAMAWQQDIMMK